MGNLGSASACIQDETAGEDHYSISDLTYDISLYKLQENMSEKHKSNVYLKRVQSGHNAKSHNVTGLIPLKTFLWCNIILPAKRPEWYSLRSYTVTGSNVAYFRGPSGMGKMHLMRELAPSLENMRYSAPGSIPISVFICSTLSDVHDLRTVHGLHIASPDRISVIVIENRLLPDSDQHKFIMEMGALKHVHIIIMANETVVAKQHTAPVFVEWLSQFKCTALLPPTASERLEVIYDITLRLFLQTTDYFASVPVVTLISTLLLSLAARAKWATATQLIAAVTQAYMQFVNDVEIAKSMTMHTRGKIEQDTFDKYLTAALAPLTCADGVAKNRTRALCGVAVAISDQLEADADVHRLKEILYDTGTVRLHVKRSREGGGEGEGEGEGAEEGEDKVDEDGESAQPPTSPPQKRARTDEAPSPIPVTKVQRTRGTMDIASYMYPILPVPEIQMQETTDGTCAEAVHISDMFDSALNESIPEHRYDGGDEDDLPLA